VADDSLDMRMDILTETTAADIVNNSSREELHKIFFEYGEERESGKIAAAIVRLRQDSPVSTSGMLAKIIDDTVTSHRKNKAKARIFQALRIAVNKELEVLQSALEDAVHLLNPTGRIVVLSYHSLEDRIVKHFFREQEKDCICPSFLPVCQCSKQSVLKVITRKPITPTGKEIEENPRARSAKMRIAEKKARTA
ncbi:MAG: 16S rRNA (cytosine(1402)-N(4))-methyltransferase RsmH, partial [Candidatus Cloacimonetes bacterium]|nr:16S rRNA (cytosine(1402)-N(4))-methyltransferase RsmH [Candidatus Cloacimonadota bacterium]